MRTVTLNKKKKQVIMLELLLLSICLVIGSLLILPQQMSHQDSPLPIPNSQDSERYTVQTREISYESNGHRIYGVARIPDTGDRVPTVIFSHGFGANHDQESTFQERLAASGVAVYAIDFSGGGSGQSEGQMLEMSVMTEKADLEGALGVIQNQNFVDKDNVFLVGASQGGVVSTLTALDHQDQIRGLILLYPAFSLFDDAHSRFDSQASIPNTSSLFGLTVGRNYFADIWDVDIFERMTDYQGPVTIFHGDRDDIVPYSYAERASQTFPQAELTRIEGAGHGFSSSEQESIVRAVQTFIRRHQSD